MSTNNATVSSANHQSSLLELKLSIFVIEINTNKFVDLRKIGIACRVISQINLSPLHNSQHSSDVLNTCLKYYLNYQDVFPRKTLAVVKVRVHCIIFLLKVHTVDIFILLATHQSRFHKNQNVVTEHCIDVYSKYFSSL